MKRLGFVQSAHDELTFQEELGRLQPDLMASSETMTIKPHMFSHFNASNSPSPVLVYTNIA